MQNCRLLLCFLEDNVLAQLGGVFLQLYLALDQFLVLARPIDLACRLVSDLDK